MPELKQQPEALTFEPATMSRDEWTQFISETASKAIAPAVQKALEPFAAAQIPKDLIEQLIARKDATGPARVIDMGKHPIGRKVRALAMATLENKSQDPDAAAHAIKNARGWAPSMVAPTLAWLAEVKATLLAGNATTAGDMIMPQYDVEWIELLRNNAVVRGLARTIPMPRGATSRRKQTSSGTAYYQGETDKMTPSNLGVGRATLSYKKLTSLSVVGNDLIRFSQGDADRLVQEDLLRVMGLREDRAFLVGNPPTDSGSPQGVRYQTAVASIYATAGASLANFQSDLTKAIRLVQAANLPADPSNSCFLMSPSTFWTIYALATTTGDMIFAAMLNAAQPNIFGFPVKLATQLEVTNSFIGAAAGLIMFVYQPALEIHDSMQRTIQTYVGGAYYDPNLAAVASGISNDETVITCIAEHDFLQVYDTAASVVTGLAT